MEDGETRSGLVALLLLVPSHSFRTDRSTATFLLQIYYIRLHLDRCHGSYRRLALSICSAAFPPFNDGSPFLPR